MYGSARNWKIGLRQLILLTTLEFLFFAMLVACAINPRARSTEIVLSLIGSMLIFGGIVIQAFPYRKLGWTYGDILLATRGRFVSVIMPSGVIMSGLSVGLIPDHNLIERLFAAALLILIGIALIAAQIYYAWERRKRLGR